MAERNRYGDRENRDVNREEDRGFFDEVRDWFRGDEPERNRDRDWERNRSQNWTYEADRDRWYDWDRNRRSGWNRDRDRNWGEMWDRGQQGDRDVNRYQGGNRDRWYDWNQGYRDWEQDLNRSRRDRFGEGRQYDQGQNRQRDWQYGQGRDFDRNTYSNRYDRNYDRGWRNEQDFNRDDYGRDFGSEYGRQDFGWQENRRDRDRWYQDRGMRGQYGTAGMRSDYGGDYDYESDYNRSRAGRTGQSRDFDPGYVGYDREGAFYQDLDEPYSYEYWEVWSVPGEFTGVGPESYRRSDERIHEEVCERLTRHGKIDARNIEIDVKDGEIVLRGSVPSRDMKRMAEDVAESVAGQKDVRNEVRVQREERHFGENSTTGRQAVMGAQSSLETSTHGRTGRATVNKDQLRQGMEVIGKNGKIVGRVKEVRDHDFLIDRDMARDVYVPFDAVGSVGAQAMLEISAEDVDNQNWETPDLL